MASDARKRKHLSTLHTARLVANLFIIAGFVLAVAVTVFSFLPSAPYTELADESDTESISKLSLLQIFHEHFGNPQLYLVVILVFWAGYLLKTIAVLAETQIDE